MYCKCGNKIPQPRVKMGYNTCIQCSTEDKWGCAQVVYHKTGNTIEIIKDKELCEEINAMAERKTFGVSNGMTGAYKKKPTVRTHKTIKEKASKLTFQEVGVKAMEINDKEGVNSAGIFIDECIKKHYISVYQGKRIAKVIFAFNNNLSYLE